MNSKTCGTIGLLCIFLAVACSSKKTEKDKKFKKEGPFKHDYVAEYGGKKITVKELENAMNRFNPLIRKRYLTLEGKKSFLDKFVRYRVLEKEARRRGIHKDPEVEFQINRLLIDRMMRDLREELIKPEDIREKEIRDYYNENIHLYQIPPKVRASMVVTKTRAEAQKVLAQAKRKPRDMNVFQDLVNKHSIDEESKAKQGDLGFFHNTDKKIPLQVIRAAFNIKEMYGVAGPVRVDKGYAVLVKTGETSAVNNTLDQERERIRTRLFQKKRITALEEYVDERMEKAKVVFYEDNLLKVQVKMPKKMSPQVERRMRKRMKKGMGWMDQPREPGKQGK